jgi:tight adherence protein B
MAMIVFPIVIALTIGLLVWGIAQVVGGLMDSDRRKIQERLSSDAGTQVHQVAASQMVRKAVEVKGFSSNLAQMPILKRVAKNLAQTWPEVSLAKFCGASLGISLAAGMVALVFTASVFIGLVAAGFGFFLPTFVLNIKRSRRQRQLADQLPEALDFMSRILRAGHSLSTGLQMMGSELPEPLATEFRHCYDSHSLGQPLEEALKETAVRVDGTDFGFFVTAVLIQRQSGGDLSEVLNNISGMIRQRIRLQQHVKAKTAEGRFSGYILVAFPGIMFGISYYLNPAYAGKLLHSGTGLGLLGLAFGLVMLGLFCIRKITTIKV